MRKKDFPKHSYVSVLHTRERGENQNATHVCLSLGWMLHYFGCGATTKKEVCQVFCCTASARSSCECSSKRPGAGTAQVSSPAAEQLTCGQEVHLPFRRPFTVSSVHFIYYLQPESSLSSDCLLPKPSHRELAVWWVYYRVLCQCLYQDYLSILYVVMIINICWETPAPLD